MVLCGNCLPMFWDNISVSSSTGKSPRCLKMGPMHCSETSVNNNHTTTHNIAEEGRAQYQTRFQRKTANAGTSYVHSKLKHINLSLHSVIMNNSGYKAGLWNRSQKEFWVEL
jgi:hypothetical protein